MPILAYDDVMLREPRLLVPRIVPIGMVAVDVSHPFGKYLKSCYVSPRYDAAKRKREVLTQVTSLTFRGTQSAYDESEDTRSTGDTIIARVILTSNNGDYGAFEYGFYQSSSVNSQLGLGLWGASNTIYGVNRSNSANVSEGLISISFPYDAILAISGVAGSYASCYENGNLVSSSLAPFGTRAADTRSRLTAFSGGSTGKAVMWIMHFSCAFDANQMRALSLTPFECLKPL